MRKLLLSCAVAFALAGAGVAAIGQINTVPQIGVASGIIKQPTYSAISIALVPASAATDIFCISGSTTKSISIKKIDISGTAGTLVTSQFTLLRRASLDTGGTAATSTALPVAAPNDSTDAAATAVLTAYTANPTINDSSPTYYRSQWLTLPVTSAGTSTVPIAWLAGEQVGYFTKAFNIAKNTTQQYCINLNATSVSSGSLDIDITWTEN